MEVLQKWKIFWSWAMTFYGNDILRQKLSYKCRVEPKHVCDDTHVHAANDVQP